MVEIDNETNEIESHPGDPQNAARRQALEAHLNQFAARAASEQDIRKIALARDALKPKGPVEDQSHDSGKSNPGQTPAELRARVLKLTQQAESDPKDAALRTQLREAINQLKASGEGAPGDAAAIKRAENFLAPWGNR
jgi:hypothetical protein